MSTGNRQKKFAKYAPQNILSRLQVRRKQDKDCFAKTNLPSGKNTYTIIIMKLSVETFTLSSSQKRSTLDTNKSLGITFHVFFNLQDSTNFLNYITLILS